MVAGALVLSHFQAQPVRCCAHGRLYYGKVRDTDEKNDSSTSSTSIWYAALSSKSGRQYLSLDPFAPRIASTRPDVHATSFVVSFSVSSK